MYDYMLMGQSLKGNKIYLNQIFCKVETQKEKCDFQGEQNSQKKAPYDKSVNNNRLMVFVRALLELNRTVNLLCEISAAWQNMTSYFDAE